MKSFLVAGLVFSFSICDAAATYCFESVYQGLEASVEAAINEGEDVAFRATGSGYQGIRVIRRSGEKIDVANTRQRFSAFGISFALNDNGDVAFTAKENGNWGLYYYDKKTKNIATIASESGLIRPYESSDISLNNNGNVYFQGQRTSDGKPALYRANKDDLVEIIGWTSPFGMAMNAFSVNASDVVAVRAMQKGANGKEVVLRIADGKTQTTFLANQEYRPLINKSGEIASYTREGSKDSVYKVISIKEGNKSLLFESRNYFEVPYMWFNDKRQFAAGSSDGKGGRGLFLLDGSLTRIIGRGDEMLGSRLIDFYYAKRPLTDKGSVLFSYQLEDKTRGLAIGRPSNGACKR